MPYRNHNQKVSAQMVTAFVVLGIVLLAIPAICAMFVLFEKLKQEKRSEIIKNATSTSTTVKQGPNGRKIFETTTIRSSPPRDAPLSPVLPFTQQQASRANRPMSVKNAWKRLSRPFSMAHIPYEDDEVELTSTRKRRPTAHSSRSQEHAPTNPDGLVSPVSPSDRYRKGSTLSWNTIDALDSSPVSAVSFTGRPSSFSTLGAHPRGYQDKPHNPSQYRHESRHADQHGADPFSNVPLTPRAEHKDHRQQAKLNVGAGSARGFVANTIKEQILTDANKAKAKQVVMGAAEAAGQYAAANIKHNVLNGTYKVGKVQLSAPPKAKLSTSRH